MSRGQRDIFTTIKTEGALLPPGILQRIIEGDEDLGGLTPGDYHLPKNERLNEVINRAWNRCAGAWRSFREKADTLPETDAGTTLTRENWLLILFQELGYGRLLTSKAREINNKTYPISHAWFHTPIHLVSFRQDLDRRTPGMAGAARMSPHSLVQEFLNRSEEHLWGIVSNGLKLRLMRDNMSLTRQAFVEFDLDAMMSGEVYSDFVLLFMLLHQSRVEAERPEGCWLERWSQEARKRGARALDQLREGVERAIEDLGKGFLAHSSSSNSDLRMELRSGALSIHDLYQEILRLVYRMIFLFVAEDRDLLIPGTAPHESRIRYMAFYSLSRVRRIAGRLKGTGHDDLWQGLKVTFQCLAKGEPFLGISPLGGFLFSPEALLHLNGCRIANEYLLKAVRHLSFTEERRVLMPVDYRNLGTEELGSVYESLLELHPSVNLDASIFELKGAAGSERKTTGSYYTPATLISCLLDSALQPVIARALTQPDPEKALLELRVVDPACGSGHFLIAAAHLMAKHLAMVRTGDSEPPPDERRAALRDVVSHCIYGVDVNPLAVELCKVALWIETLDPGKPLGFLDHHIKSGNSLIGATPELLEQGVPDDAFKPLVTDDPAIARQVRENNKRHRKGVRSIFTAVKPLPKWQKAVKGLEEIVALPETEAMLVREKAKRYETFLMDEAYRHQRRVADLWTAAFFWPLTDETIAATPTEDLFRTFQQGGCSLNDDVQKGMAALAARHSFFHWHLEFPEVFTDEKRQGFDCVLGNPPWEHIEIAEKEFFAHRDPEIANAPNAAARKRLIEKLPETNPDIWAAFMNAKRTSECESHFLRASGKYPLSAVGRINTYQIFAGLARGLVAKDGSAGIILPSGIATDDTNKQFFADLTEKHALISLYDFENREKLFPDVDSRMKFCLLTMGGAGAAPRGADFTFFLTNTEQMKEQDRHFTLSAEDISLLNPNTRTCPIFRSRRDAEITKAIYRRCPVLIDETKGEEGNPWGISFRQGLFNMANDSHLFMSREQLEAEGWTLCDNKLDNTPEDNAAEGAKTCAMTAANIFRKGAERYLPLYEAKMVHQFNHRFGYYRDLPRDSNSTQLPDADEARLQGPSYAPLPRWWVHESHVEERLSERWRKGWILGWRDITNTTNERTVISGIIPRMAAGHTFLLMFPDQDIHHTPCLMANINSFVLDYVARQKIGGTHLNYFIMKQLPALPPSQYDQNHPLIKNGPISAWISKRVLELTYTSWELKPLAEECSYFGPPFTWDKERRFLIRCEIDALFFHLYGITRDDADYILETFPIVKRKDMAAHGEYRTKRLILECFDAMNMALDTGNRSQI